MSIPQDVLRLIERFDRHRDDYKCRRYDETRIRREFIEPFFEALGWDIGNKFGHAEAHKDVIHEGAIKPGGAIKAPDYCFRAGGVRKFFLEAKKPSINLKDDPTPAFRLRRYAWSAKLPLSILTDFEEFIVYDGRVRPEKNDKPSTARILYLHYSDYEQRWGEITSIFSREAVLRGSFDQYAESNKVKKGTVEVDAALLREIESWRDSLARNLALRNPGLTQRDLNFAVQRTIDRIIFLRICEDRRIERYGGLLELLHTGEVYKNLITLFHRADERYNSGLFHFQHEKGRPEPPDPMTPRLDIDDKPLREIIKGLYYPDSPYEFSVISADILGQVYEQFLGKVIRLTPCHQAKVEDKPEVRKAGGVYYTPAYIVEYIVKHTVGRLCEGKTPKQVAKFRILDPACGSGSFLIGAYQYLLDWHLNWYIADGPEKHTRQLYRGATGERRLTAAERKRVLLNNIYGVDIDAQAVEVTKLSLLLKVLEGESEETLSAQLRLFHGRSLPDLSSNIKCGNSLIEADFYEGEQAEFLDEEERHHMNAFAWEDEFEEIMGEGGFHAVIGNPPYVRAERLERRQLSYFKNKYSAEGQADLYLLFIERALNLLRAGGYFAFITPKFLLFNLDAEATRRRMMGSSILRISDVGQAFKGVNTECAISVLTSKSRNHGKVEIEVLSKRGSLEWANSIRQRSFRNFPNLIFNIYLTELDLAIIKKIKKCAKPLSSFLSIKRGMEIGKKAVRDSAEGVMTLLGEDVGRYFTAYGRTYVDPGAAEVKRLLSHSQVGEKILIRRVCSDITATIDGEGYCYTKNLYGALNQSDMSLEYFLGLINSKLMNYFFKKYFTTKKKDIFPEFQKYQLDNLPIRPIDLSDPADKELHQKMTTLVDRMLTLNSEMLGARTSYERNALRQHINDTGHQIDRLVYRLYGISDEEIAIVEDAVP
ncbi:MAG: Eco57I restriction-modification methylase domain-containing protein [Blastocatellia bacterium]